MMGVVGVDVVSIDVLSIITMLRHWRESYSKKLTNRHRVPNQRLDVLWLTSPITATTEYSGQGSHVRRAR